MKNLSFILLGIICIQSVFSQENFSREFGKITQYEADMTSYEEDPEAEAVILYEIGSTFFQSNTYRGRFELNTTRRKKIKIFNQAGFQ